MRVIITITTTMSVLVLQPKAMLKSSWHPMTSPKLPMIVTKAPFPAAPSSTAFGMMARFASPKEKACGNWNLPPTLHSAT